VEEEVFIWLQSLDDTDLALCLANLDRIKPEYDPLVDEADLEVLGEYDPADLLLYTVVVIPPDP
jgi:flagellar assembly factor FliW